MDHDVAPCVTPPEEKEADLALTTEEGHPLGQGGVGSRRHEILLTGEIVPHVGQTGFQLRALGIVFRGRDLLLERGDLVGEASDEQLVGASHGSAVFQHLTRHLVADHMHVGRVDLVPVGVIEVVVSVDHVADGLVGEGFDLVDDGLRGSGGDVGFDEQYIVIVDDHRAVRTHRQAAGPAGVVHSRHDFLEFERGPVIVGAGWKGGVGRGVAAGRVGGLAGGKHPQCANEGGESFSHDWLLD